MEHTDQQIKIAIAGGGIAGLALAVGLSKKHEHIDFHVFEGANAYAEVGSGLAMHLNAINAMNLIDPALYRAYADRGLLMGEGDVEMSTEVIMAYGPTKGELVAKLGTAKGRKTVRRASLLEGFSELVPAGRISFGKRLSKVEQDSKGVALTFEDGSEASADCLIGADGINSPTRKHILGSDHPACQPVNHDGWHLHHTIVPMSFAISEGLNEKWTRVVPILIGPKGYIHCMPLDKGRNLSATVAVRADQGSGTPTLDHSCFNDYSPDAQQIANLVGKDTTYWATQDHDPAPIYYKGRVAMMGDAAHATLPFNGQGAAQALEDAAVLDHLISELTSEAEIEALFSAYDAVRRPRSQTIAEISRKFGRMYVFSEGSMHEDIPTMRRTFAEYGKYSNGANLAKQNEDAMTRFKNSKGMSETQV